MALSIGTDLLNAVLFEGAVQVLRSDAATRYSLTITEAGSTKRISSIEVIQQNTSQCLALTSDGGLYVLDLLTGANSKIYTFGTDTKVNSITTSPQGQIYVVTQSKSGGGVDVKLEELTVDAITGDSRLEENEFTKQFNNFAYVPAMRTGSDINVDDSQSYQTVQFHLGYDSSPYIIAQGIDTPDDQGNGQLFLASPSGDSDENNGVTGGFNFTKISGDSQHITEVVAVNATTALALAFDQSRTGPSDDARADLKSVPGSLAGAVSMG